MGTAKRGDFAETNFGTNIGDLVAAARYLEQRDPKPLLLVGRSWGGTAVLAAASRIPASRAVVTLGAPFDPAHVQGLLGDAAAEAREQGAASVRIAGRSFRITRQFLEDASSHKMEEHLSRMSLPLLVLHSSSDEVVEVANADRIMSTARQPKSFVSLDGMDQLISSRTDRQYVGRLIAAWAARYFLEPEPGRPG